MDKKTKLLIFVDSLRHGGAERQVIQDANLLSKLGYDVTVAFMVKGPFIDQLDNDILIIELKNKSIIGNIYELSLILSKGHYDRVISHLFKSNFICFTACILTNNEFIAFEHGLGKWKKWHHRILSHLVGMGANQIITCSEQSKVIRIQYDRIPDKKVQVIYNSVNIEGHNKHSLKRKNTFFSIGFVGRFNKVKQLGTFIELAKILILKGISDFKIILVGDGPEMNQIKRLINENNLNQFFELPGYTTNPLLYLETFDLFILPSETEDFSLALLEAGACGLPCIAFDVGGNKEIIKNGITGYTIPPFNVNAMADRVIILNNNKPFSDQMGQNAILHISNSFNQEVRSQKLTNILK